MKPIHLSISLLAVLAPLANAAEYGSAPEAEALVHKAVTHIKAAGPQSAYADFTSKAPGWVDRDLYVVVYGLDGSVLAHGQNAKQVGKNMLDFKDADGKEFVRERVDLARSKGKFWHDYKFTDPVSKKILPKSMYCERLQETAVCSGIYKR